MAELTHENQTYKCYRYVLDNKGMVDRFNKKHCQNDMVDNRKLGDTVNVRVIKKFNPDTYNGETIQIPESLMQWL